VPAHDDMMLGYVQHLTRGHVLDELDRPADAAAAYRRALEFMPTPQGAAIGLAAALLRSGDAEAAAAAAIAAKRLPRLSYGADPRVRFRQADARFLPLWLAEIRKLRR
jgi:cytochrome c-type biogenesis protein CcmH/NrfG